MARRSSMRRWPATAGLLIAFVAAWIATWFDPDHHLFLLFAKVNAPVRQGEVWRLFTASFLHAGVLHLTFNAFALAAIGPPVERVYGRIQYLLAFLVGGAVGMAASVVFVPQPSVGASAGVFALLGLLLAHCLRFWKTLPEPSRKLVVREMLLVVVLNLAIGVFARFVDNAAHLGGLAGGFALGLVLQPQAALLQPQPTGAQPARSIAQPGRAWLGWAGQRWKMIVFGVFLVAEFIALFADAQRWGALGVLASLVGFAVALTARCPNCKVRVVWWCASKLPAGRSLSTAFALQHCPVCRYPEGAAAPGAAT